MTDIKWIPVDPENLPKGEVLAMRANLWLVGKLEKETNSSTVLVSFSTTDENTYFFNPVAYIPLDNLKQLWEEQNPANRYSSDSEAFKLLEWVIESDSSLGKALGEIPVEAEHTIEILAQQIINQSWLVEDAPRSPSRASYKFFSFREELIYWIKYLLD
ncbi:hypothetical protein [Dolichospermum planctonicum]|uniref:Uncharacterized protein n=1 Tax=Dolichospermum planctonicum TaxID=136072 RepID=A0A480AL26_9CYAN|nr:hypothetical protein [Dolichospermum planctonicum]GCL43741.1 hypothetical protein NIES80_34600 [Dolichospermum planctonicum]